MAVAISKATKRVPQPTATPSAGSASLQNLIAGLDQFDLEKLRLQWRNHLGGIAPAHLPRWLLMRVLAYRLQAAVFGDLDSGTLRLLKTGRGDGDGSASQLFVLRAPASRDGIGLKPGALLVREWQGKLERVMVLEIGFTWNGKSFGSLSQIAKAITGTSWNGHRFFGLAPKKGRRPESRSERIGKSDSASGAYA